MISVTRLRNGVTFEDKGNPYRVLKYQHTHISRGSGSIKVKVRNLSNGSVSNLTYKSGANVNEIDVEKRKLQYLYQDEEDLVFMDPKSFEQVTLKKSVVGGQEKFLREGKEVSVFFLNDGSTSSPQSKILDLDLAPNFIYRVAQTDPGEKGNSATNVYKPATLRNGMTVKVPLFIKVGDKVKVDTRTGEYVERVS